MPSRDAATSWEWPNAGPMIDLTCSVCQSRGVGTYELPVGCMNCGLQAVGSFSRGHEAYHSQKCPDCGCTTLSSICVSANAAWTPAPGGFLERNPHLIENYLAICEELGETPGEPPEEVGAISRVRPSEHIFDYFRRLHGLA